MTVTTILIAIVVGAVIGVLGRLALPGRQPIGILLTIGVGIVAALLGTAIAQQIGVDHTDGIDWIELLMQVALAAVGVAIVAAVQRRSHTGTRR
ncbi:GlsB/YeaQ/YmgE family stress response membrane protein [Actinomadura parmotrematis]|uniref:GlsB/YeaQ/YmgE family stress response membrane protein n=1 Tax=Actinomadura parmotrematis TaxID=2864039 RepID=A0ABS7FUD6_9ACTN|nr:GlsB/YeaQ/YmgE family stress response membrane protein [Actinomadura parmotrematis]MBW8484026.1 GlsB/YeaQ/YmgE family stress response membrane protein [Actinomadura parmotrematis]